MQSFLELKTRPGLSPIRQSLSMAWRIKLMRLCSKLLRFVNFKIFDLTSKPFKLSYRFLNPKVAF